MADKIDYRANREKAWRQTNLDSQKAIDDKRQVAIDTKKATLENSKADLEKKKKDLAGKDQDLITSTYQSVINDKDYYEASEEKGSPVKHDIGSLNAGTVNKAGQTITPDDVINKRSALAKYLIKNRIYIADAVERYTEGDDGPGKEKVGHLAEKPEDRKNRWIGFIKKLAEYNRDNKKDADAGYVYNNIEQPEYSRHAVKLIEAFLKDKGKNPDKYKKNYKDGE